MLMRVNEYDYQQPVVANQPRYNKTKGRPDRVRYGGVVKLLNVEKSFGFIRCDDFKDDLFFHIGGVGCGGFVVGCKVNFSIVSSGRGPMAVNVKCRRG